MTTHSNATPAFKELNLPEALLKATDELGFENCTEIQGLSLPIIASGNDIAAQAQTGTGKTAAFLLGAFARLLEHPAEQHEGRKTQNQPRMLVIAPTRELAIQIGKDAQKLGKHTQLRTAVVYGGIDYEKQRKQLADGIDVLIGTPGRLIDYFKQKVFNLKGIEICVLDEADRMFDLGFISDIRFLLRRMPPPEQRLSMLFSATLSHRVMELAYEHMNNPTPVKTETTGVTADGVNQQLFQPATDEKISLLLGLMQQMQPTRTIVFVNTKRTAEYVESYLMGNDIPCGTLSGDVRQNKRQRILADFTGGALPVLIATDVAARGLHIDDVTHVFNYDLPQQAEDYVHRIGRTARAGTQGEAVSFACEEYSFSLPEIQEYIGKAIPLAAITNELLITPKKAKRIERDRVNHSTKKRGAKQDGNKRRSRRSRSKKGNDGGTQGGKNANSATKNPNQKSRNKPKPKNDE
jgi:ATP-dependent RNA helicase RhlB